MGYPGACLPAALSCPSGGRSCRPRVAAQHDQSLGAGHLAAATDAVDDTLQMVQVGDTDAHERVWVAGDRESFHDLGEPLHRALDVIDLSRARKAKLCESFDLAAKL